MTHCYTFNITYNWIHSWDRQLVCRSHYNDKEQCRMSQFIYGYLISFHQQFSFHRSSLKVRKRFIESRTKRFCSQWPAWTTARSLKKAVLQHDERWAGSWVLLKDLVLEYHNIVSVKPPLHKVAVPFYLF